MLLIQGPLGQAVHTNHQGAGLLPEAGIVPSSLPSAPSIGAILLQILFCSISESLPLLLAACTSGEYSSHPTGFQPGHEACFGH